MFSPVFVAAWLVFAVTLGVRAMPNPASVNCVNKGGVSVTYESAQGEVGVCWFSSDRCCEEWQMFRQNDQSCPADGLPLSSSIQPKPQYAKYTCNPPKQAAIDNSAVVAGVSIAGAVMFVFYLAHKRFSSGFSQLP
jgi:hypothetical protein